MCSILCSILCGCGRTEYYIMFSINFTRKNIFIWNILFAPSASALDEPNNTFGGVHFVYPRRQQIIFVRIDKINKKISKDWLNSHELCERMRWPFSPFLHSFCSSCFQSMKWTRCVGRRCRSITEIVPWKPINFESVENLCTSMWCQHWFRRGY